MSSCPESRRFEFLSWPQASKAASKKGSTLVWPFGAFEQHGPHLPLITDTFFANKIIQKVLKQIPEEKPIWILPPQSIGFSPEHASFPGTISLSAEVMLRLITEVGKQLANMGFKRLVFFNAHGGQIGLLQAVARQLRVQCPTMAVLPCFLWSGVSQINELIPSKEVEEGLHAALAETSLMLHLDPQLVGSERPTDGLNQDINWKNNFKDSGEINIPAPTGWSLEGAAPCAWLTKDLSQSGVIGDSIGSTKELGESLENALVVHWVKLFSSLMNSEWPPINQ